MANKLTDDELKKYIGLAIRSIRLDKGLILADLVESMTSDYNYVGQVETGKINFTIRKLNEIAYALDVCPFEIFSLAKTLYEQENK